MSPHFPTPRFHLELPARSVVTLPDAAGIDIECRRGCVWLTLDHDGRDIVLAAGERFVGDRHRRALVSALEPSCIAVSHALPAALPAGDAAPAARGAPTPSPWRLALGGLSPA